MKGSEKYLAEMSGSLAQEHFIALGQLYTPIASASSINLYTVLLGEANRQKPCEIRKLLTLSGMDINDFELALQGLEKCELLESFAKKDEGLYLFVLLKPLSPKEFLSHEIYGHIYLDKVGKKVFESVKSTLVEPSVDKGYFENITHKMDLSLTSWTALDELTYSQLKYANPNDEKYIFDIKKFLRELEDAILPAILRTDEVTTAIASLGTTFAVSEDNMRKFLKNSVNYKTATIDLEDLRKRCLANKKIEVADVEDEYQLPPIAFLFKRRGVAVASSDKLFLERCQNEYYLKREVINVLIETVLNNNDNRFPIKYAEKIASEWGAIHIDSKQKALEEINKTSGEGMKGATSNKNVFTLDEMDVKQADIDEIRKKLFAKG